jgi:hypothetical protein
MTLPSLCSPLTAGFPTATGLLSGTQLIPFAGPGAQQIYASNGAACLNGCRRIALGRWLGHDFTVPPGPSRLPDVERLAVEAW